MKRKRTSDVGQWWNIVEIHHFQMREILKWSHFDEEKKNIRRWSMMKYCWNSIIFREILKWSEIFMKRKRTSNVGQWWNIVEIHHRKRNSKMIWFWWFWWRENEHQDVGQWWNIVEIHDFQRNSKMIRFWWREKEHQTLVNDEILLKFIIMREILKWSDFDEEKKNIRRWSMMKYCWNSSS